MTNLLLGVIRVKTKYINLAAEMARAGLGVGDMAKKMHCSKQNVYSKLSGKSEFALSDMVAIQKAIEESGNCGTVSLDYLFHGQS